MPFVIRQLRQRSTGFSNGDWVRSREFKKVTCTHSVADLQHRFAAIVESVEQQKASQRAHWPNSTPSSPPCNPAPSGETSELLWKSLRTLRS